MSGSRQRLTPLGWLIVFWFLFCLAGAGAAVWVVLHFVLKYW